MQTRFPPTESSGLKIQIPPRRVRAQNKSPAPTQSSVEYGPILLEPQSSQDLTGVNTSPGVIYRAARSLPAPTENPSVNPTVLTIAPELDGSDLTGAGISPSVIYSGPGINYQAARSLPAATDNFSVNLMAMATELDASGSRAHAETSTPSGSGNAVGHIFPFRISMLNLDFSYLSSHLQLMLLYNKL